MELFGKKVFDIETGFKGIVTGVAYYKDLETRYLIESIDSTGRPIEWWLSRNRFEVIEE